MDNFLENILEAFSNSGVDLSAVHNVAELTEAFSSIGIDVSTLTTEQIDYLSDYLDTLGQATGTPPVQFGAWEQGSKRRTEWTDGADLLAGGQHTAPLISCFEP